MHALVCGPVRDDAGARSDVRVAIAQGESGTRGILWSHVVYRWRKAWEYQTSLGQAATTAMVWFRIAAVEKIEASGYLTPTAYRTHTVSAIQGSLPSSQRRRSVLGRRNLRQSPRLSILCFEYTSLAGETAATANLRNMSETVTKDNNNATVLDC